MSLSPGRRPNFAATVGAQHAIGEPGWEFAPSATCNPAEIKILQRGSDNGETRAVFVEDRNPERQVRCH